MDTDNEDTEKKVVNLLSGVQIGASLVAQWLRIHLQCRSHERCRFSPWVGKIPWRRKRQPTPVFLPGESHGQRSLVGCSPWGRKESDMALKQLSTHAGGIHRGPGRGQEVASGWRHQGC